MHATVHFFPLVDPTLDRVGFPLDHPYLEQVYCSVLGPTSTLLLRRVGRLFDAYPDGLDVDLVETSRFLGLGVRPEAGEIGKRAPIARAMGRIAQFHLATWRDEDHYGVRTKLPAISRGKALHLAEPVQALHQRLLTNHLDALVAAERRSPNSPATQSRGTPPPVASFEEPTRSDVAERLRSFGTNGHDPRAFTR